MSKKNFAMQIINFSFFIFFEVKIDFHALGVKSIFNSYPDKY